MTFQARSAGTSTFFNNFGSVQEQDLLDDLITESIRIYGIDLYYIPRILISYDSIYGEDDISEYQTAIPIEMYIKNVDGFEGEGVFLSKFGLEIRDQVSFTVSRRRFEQYVGTAASIVRPNEGDLIYYPLNKKAFQIRFVNYLPVHYPLGALQTWDLTCELFEYSNEKFSTGIAEIDELQTKFSTDLLEYSLVDENGNYIVDEHGNYFTDETYVLSDILPGGADNEPIQTEQDANNLIDWSEVDPFSEGFY